MRTSPNRTRMEQTGFHLPLDELGRVRSEEGKILTQPFLDVCKCVLPALDKFGAAFSFVRNDVSGNISRLESRYQTDPSEYRFLFRILEKEIEAKTQKESSSCINALLWLTRKIYLTSQKIYQNFVTRIMCQSLIGKSEVLQPLMFVLMSMDYSVQMFRNLHEHENWSMREACTDSYRKTLKKWHGWLASSSFSVAMNLLPDRKSFMEVLSSKGDLGPDIEKFCTSFSSVLQENHKFLASVGMDS